MSSLTTLIFRSLLAITLLLHTIPRLVCFLHLHWPLPPHLENICKSGFAQNAVSEVNIPPLLSSLTDRLTALEEDSEWILARVAALEADVPAIWNPLLLRVTTLETSNRESTSARNFAHFGDGARVLIELTSPTRGTKNNNWLRESPNGARVYPVPPYVVSDVHMDVGSCWEIEGSAGLLAIILSEPIHISSLRYNNIDPRLVLTASLTKTPRTIALWGLLPNSSITPPAVIKIRHPEHFSSKSMFIPKSAKMKGDFVLLLSTHYDPRGATTDQLFRVPSDHWTAGIMFQVVIVEVLENWGGQTTCLYRLQIHGQA